MLVESRYMRAMHPRSFVTATAAASTSRCADACSQRWQYDTADCGLRTGPLTDYDPLPFVKMK